LEARDCPSYTILDLGSLGGNGAAEAVNASGQVAGEAYSAGDQFRHAFLWQSSTGMIDLGTLGGPEAEANAINRSGQVVGWADTAATDPTWGPIYHPFLWQNGVMTDLGSLGLLSGAAAVNATGQVVGSCFLVNPDGTQDNHAFLWQGGVMTDLNRQLPANSGWDLQVAEGINDTGQITGYGTHNGLLRAFLLSGGTVADLGTLSSPGHSWGYALNNSGQVVGQSSTRTAADHAFLYGGGTMKDLGALSLGKDTSSEAHAINASAQVVGFSRWESYDLSSGSQRATLWQGNQKTDINSLLPRNSGWVLTAAYGINDTGAIVGTGNHSGYGGRPFLLLPGSPLQAPAPSPASIPATQGQPLAGEATARWGAADLLQALVSLESEGQMRQKH
jgi:probable HAF family extracellular repeat protein